MLVLSGISGNTRQKGSLQSDMGRTGPPLVVDHRGGMGFTNFQQAMGPVRRSAPGPAVEGGCEAPNHVRV